MKKKQKIKQRINKRHFKGKTISYIKCDAVNCVTFIFTDGTIAELEVAAVGLNLYGIEEVQNVVE